MLKQSLIVVLTVAVIAATGGCGDTQPQVSAQGAGVDPTEIRRALESNNESQLLMAASLAGTLGEKGAEVTPALEPLLKHPNKSVQKAARDSLNQIQAKLQRTNAN